MELKAGSRTSAPATGWHRLHHPVAVFLIAFGATRVGSLLGWSGRHRDAVRTLGLGDGAVTALLVVSTGVELLLTIAAVLAVARRRAVWLLLALAGWLVELAALTIAAAIAGDVAGIAEHGLSLLAFGGVLAVTYRRGDARTLRLGGKPGVDIPGREISTPAEEATTPPAGGDITRRDIPVRESDTTRKDLPAGDGDATRKDITVRPNASGAPSADRGR